MKIAGTLFVWRKVHEEWMHWHVAFNSSFPFSAAFMKRRNLFAENIFYRHNKFIWSWKKKIRTNCENRAQTTVRDEILLSGRWWWLINLPRNECTFTDTQIINRKENIRRNRNKKENPTIFGHRSAVNAASRPSFRKIFKQQNAIEKEKAKTKSK